MKVFVAGGTGVIGRRAVPALIAAGHDVRAVARTEDKASELARAGATPVRVDLFDGRGVREAVVGSEAVVNLATAIPPFDRLRNAGAWVQNDRLRRSASRFLAEAARAAGASAFIQESVVLLYADHGDGWVTEEDPIARAWTNLDSAIEAERHAAWFTEQAGRGIVLRFGTFHAADASHIRSMVEMAARRKLPIAGRGDHYGSAIHADDAARAVVAALDAPAGTYNVVDDEPMRNRDAVAALTEAFGHPAARRVPRWLMRRVGGGPMEAVLRSIRASNGRFVEATSWRPAYPSLAETWPAIAEATAATS